MYVGFPGSSAGKESSCNGGHPGSIPELGISPREGNDYPLQYSCLEDPYGQRSFMGYNPECHKELDMSKQLSAEQHTYIYI